MVQIFKETRLAFNGYAFNGYAFEMKEGQLELQKWERCASP